MKVLHICEYTKGGIETYISEVLSYQKQAQHISKTSIVLSDYGVNEKVYEDANPYIYNYVRKPQHFLNAIKEISKAVKAEQPDIIHVHSTFAGVFARLPFLFKSKRPLIVYCSHGWSFTMEISTWKKKIFGFVERVLASKTDLIINISNNELNESLAYNLPKEKSVVVYNGIKDKQTDSAKKLDLDLDQTKINLLFIGRFDKQKGLDILIDFFMKNPLKNVKLYVIGESVLKESSIQMPDNIVSLGWVDNEMIDQYYKAFDAVIVPSRWEGFGLVAIEAMRNKKALIVSDRGALPELVENGVNGYSFDLDNYGELKSVLSDLRKDTLEEMGEKGYAMFLDKFTSEQMNQKIIEQYQVLINQK
ncbi:glycosyltransferase family 4 protein [Priestia megaterium]|uniref:glycosyltransferase family 4 protein n=1 Tax=Priestia megaterium TaxID=1404 RepID=UPI0022B8D5CD|nr:glycosyltransferase family 4 protein [Priestia megaterium]MCZ8493374.1 glycosyltransferase family 4 protein [Priestia megaterium]